METPMPLFSPAQSGGGATSEELVLRLLFQLIVILCVTRGVVLFVRRLLGQTDVSGEILAGLLLGPSLLGALFPSFTQQLFDPTLTPVFKGLAEIGLIFFMFQVGQEFEFGMSFAADRRTMVGVSVAGMLAPFTLGFMVAPWIHARLPQPSVPLLGFQLFFATALSITAIPVLGRIFLELKLAHTRIAALVMSAAALEDVGGWLLLSVIAAIVHANFAPLALLGRIAGLALFLALLFLVVRPLLKRAIAAHMERHGTLTSTGTALIMIALFLAAAATSLLGVFAIIGGFCLAVALHDDRRFVAEWRARISPLVSTLLLPIFFTYTGLRTDIGLLQGLGAWALCALVLLIAFCGKFGGAYLAARFLGEDHRHATIVGICMNTRGLMELIALNIGYDLGVLPRSVFTMLVIMAIASTFITTPIIRRLMRAELRQPEHSAGRELLAGAE